MLNIYTIAQMLTQTYCFSPNITGDLIPIDRAIFNIVYKYDSYCIILDNEEDAQWLPEFRFNE